VYGQNFRHPVEIMETAPDTVGSRLAYQVKEHIQKSASMRLTYENDDRLQVRLVTLDPYANDPPLAGILTVFSVVYTWMNAKYMIMPYFMTQFVGPCGANRVQECAEIITAKAYAQIEIIIMLRGKMAEGIERGKEGKAPKPK
jgi:hypothetical protein